MGKIHILTSIFQRGFNHQLDHHLKQPAVVFGAFCCFHKPHIQSPCCDPLGGWSQFSSQIEDWRHECFWAIWRGKHNPRSVRGLKPWFSLPGIQALGPLILQKFQRFLRFAPLQFAFCSELRPGLVTPELLASVIDKIAAVASVTGWILLGFYRESYRIQICTFV